MEVHESSPLPDWNLTCVGSQGSADLAEVQFSSATAPTVVQLQELQRTAFAEAWPARVCVVQSNRVSAHSARFVMTGRKSFRSGIRELHRGKGFSMQ